jgi:hypothetical protein
MPGEPKTSKRRIEAVDKQRKAVELRKSGASYERIAEEIGYSSKSGAFKAVAVALLKTLQEPADGLRRLEVERLDDILEKMWDKRDKPIYADRILKVMERRAKLLGLDAPTKIAPTDPTGEREYEGLSDDDRVARLAAIFEQAREKRDRQTPVGDGAGTDPVDRG